MLDVRWLGSGLFVGDGMTELVDGLPVVVDAVAVFVNEVALIVNIAAVKEYGLVVL